MFLKEAGLFFKANQIVVKSNLFSILSNVTKLLTELDVQPAPEVEGKPFNISTINTAIYNYYIKNHKKDNTTLFYTTYENLSEAVNNLFKDYI